jgi:hypothetical protein
MAHEIASLVSKSATFARKCMNLTQAPQFQEETSTPPAPLIEVLGLLWAKIFHRSSGNRSQIRQLRWRYHQPIIGR